WVRKTVEDGRRIRLRERTVIDEERSAAVGICQPQRSSDNGSGVSDSRSGVRTTAAEVRTAAAEFGQRQWVSVSGNGG
ncbi:hypothetical protein MHH60_26235, partial [Paenibacillus sp. FSL H7-0716]